MQRFTGSVILVSNAGIALVDRNNELSCITCRDVGILSDLPIRQGWGKGLDFIVC